MFIRTKGVLSALRHDSIIDAGNPDYALVEGEAERVAKEAVRELILILRRLIIKIIAPNCFFRSKC